MPSRSTSTVRNSKINARALVHEAQEPKVWDRKTLGPNEGVLPHDVPLPTGNTVPRIGIFIRVLKRSLGP